MTLKDSNELLNLEEKNISMRELRNVLNMFMRRAEIPNGVTSVGTLMHFAWAESEVSKTALVPIISMGNSLHLIFSSVCMT